MYKSHQNAQNMNGTFGQNMNLYFLNCPMLLNYNFTSALFGWPN